MTRWTRFICWWYTGHFWDKTLSNKMMSRTMNRCINCGLYKAGPD